MRRFIEEYLSMLREDGELESLLNSLVTSMGMKVRAKPQKGVRQSGVDIHAIGKDEDGIRKNFLITIKRGDINRTIWNERNTGIRDSLDEIIDVYIQNRMGKHEKNLPIKIIVCCGGMLNQEVKENWDAYQKKYDYEFDLWNGSSLSRDIQDNLLNELIIFEEEQKKMRRTLVLLSDVNYDLVHFKVMIDELLFKKDWKSIKPRKLHNFVEKTLSMISVCLGMINEYSNENKNLIHSIVATEYCILKFWGFIQQNNLDKPKGKIVKQYNKVLQMYAHFSEVYFNKIYASCFVKNGICKNCYERIGASEVVFKQIGLLSTYGLILIFCAPSAKNNQVITKALMSLIQNNSISNSPAFDGFTIEICLAVFLLALQGEHDFLRGWFKRIIDRFSFSYVLGRGFPVSHDSIDKLIEFEYNEEHSKEDMTSMSSLLPTIAYWCAILNFTDIYNMLLDLIQNALQHCNLQMWYPTKGIKENLSLGYTGNDYGVSEVPIYLPKDLSELKQRIESLLSFSQKSDQLETDWQEPHSIILSIIASRHFKTPVNPFLWLRLINDSSQPA
ncbi:Uncharacterised protein [Legionella busanensis]|uniref:Chemotaxis protein n=1 Tax=Legionella busanensis TaxID=190655 RepID=A0A378JJP6_9GAMM|nr:hypothetical protein [Legionella busanensis]STX50918.1 Uncharacterised protein [Legionella busanensis]